MRMFGEGSTPAETAAWAATADPGIDVVAALTAIDPREVDGTTRIDLLVGLERQLSWLAAAQQRVIAALAGRALDWSGTESVDYTREQVGAALRLSPGHAADRLAIARALVDRLPATLNMLERGELTYLHARKVADAVAPFDAAIAGQIEQRVLPCAPQQTVGQFGTSVRRAVIAADPRQAEQRHGDALADRRVVITPQDDGMATMWAYLPADGAALIKTVLDSLGAAKARGDVRTADQRRADCLVDTFARVLGDPSLPEQHGHRPSIQVAVAVSTLLGCDERPAQLDGYGPITAAMARQIAADPSGTWRRLLTDPATGQVLEFGRKTYRPPANVADHVIARDRTCVFPGCARLARSCELDHGVEWSRGGHTGAEALHPLCTRHHHARHNSGWTVRRQSDGSYRWTAPTGHAYLVPPPDDG